MGCIASALSNRGRFSSTLLVLALSAGSSEVFAQRGDSRVVKSETAVASEGTKRSAEGSPLRKSCGGECAGTHVNGSEVTPVPSVVASPEDTTYSVHHRLGADLDGAGPQDISCFFIYNPALPGAQDDIVLFDNGLTPEPLRTDILGTTPTVIESDTASPGGRRTIIVETQAPSGRDLFPPGFEAGGLPLTDACFSIGLDDPLSWANSDIVHGAEIEFLINGVTSLGPLDASFFFVNPWNGVTTITLPGGAGRGYNGVRLTLNIEKSITIPNDNCRGQFQITDGITEFSTIGANTDGPEEPGNCNFFLYPNIGSDIWYRYRATCTGNLTIDLCGSSYDTKFAVYDQCLNCPIDPGALACNDDFCGQRSYAVVPVVQDQCLTIRVGGYQGLQGDGSLILSCDVAPPPSGACCSLGGSCVGTMTETECQLQQGSWTEGMSCPSFNCPVTPPINDYCDDCIRVLTNQPFEGRSTAATGTDITPSCSDNDFKDVWHCWTADCTGQVSVTTCGSDLDFDTTLAVFSSCGGAMISCDDDSCQAQNSISQSMITFEAVSGTTYYFRVAGYNGDSGQYTLTVEPCKNACCRDDGLCALSAAAQCLAAGATPLGDGTTCRGDADDDGIDDACEQCPQASIVFASPEDGTIDARQPHSKESVVPRQGIGAPAALGVSRESIVVRLDPPVANVGNCFSLCETIPDGPTGPNDIQTATYVGGGVYELVLKHAIAPGKVTTIEYLGDGSFVEYTSHAADVDGDGTANSVDVQRHITCCLRNLCQAPFGQYSCDTDRSTRVTPADLLYVVDLLVGSGEFDEWVNTVIPENTVCP